MPLAQNRSTDETEDPDLGRRPLRALRATRPQPRRPSRRPVRLPARPIPRRRHDLRDRTKRAGIRPPYLERRAVPGDHPGVLRGYRPGARTAANPPGSHGQANDRHRLELDGMAVPASSARTGSQALPRYRAGSLAGVDRRCVSGTLSARSHPFGRMARREPSPREGPHVRVSAVPVLEQVRRHQAAVRLRLRAPRGRLATLRQVPHLRRPSRRCPPPRLLRRAEDVRPGWL